VVNLFSKSDWCQQEWLNLFSKSDWCQQEWLTAGEFCMSFTAVYCIMLPDRISAKFPKIL